MKLTNTSSAVILSHFNERTDNAGFPPQLIRDYLLGKIKKIVYIEHAFPHAHDHRSSMTIYENGKVTKTIFTPNLSGPAPLFYIADIFITWYFLLKATTRYDLCVALDNLNTFSVAPFKSFGIIKKLVYYTIDYTPLRFPNKTLNNIYHYLDRQACYAADAIWALSERMAPARKKNGVDSKKTAPTILLPMGANLERIKPLPFEKINNKQLIFVGHLLEKQGLQLIIEVLPQIIKKIPDVKLMVVGQGEYKATLEQLVKKLGITKHVIFKGFVKTHEDVEKLLCQSAIGVALYKPADDNYTYYTDPGKPKLYLACGLPIIITDIPASAKVIEKNKAGVIVDYTEKSVEKAILTLLTQTTYKRYRENALELAKQFDTNTMITNALKKTN